MAHDPSLASLALRRPGAPRLRQHRARAHSVALWARRARTGHPRLRLCVGDYGRRGAVGLLHPSSGSPQWPVSPIHILAVVALVGVCSAIHAVVHRKIARIAGSCSAPTSPPAWAPACSRCCPAASSATCCQHHGLGLMKAPDRDDEDAQRLGEGLLAVPLALMSAFAARAGKTLVNTPLGGRPPAGSAIPAAVVDHHHGALVAGCALEAQRGARGGGAPHAGRCRCAVPIGLAHGDDGLVPVEQRATACWVWTLWSATLAESARKGVPMVKPLRRCCCWSSSSACAARVAAEVAAAHADLLARIGWKGVPGCSRWWRQPEAVLAFVAVELIHRPIAGEAVVVGQHGRHGGRCGAEVCSPGW